MRWSIIFNVLKMAISAQNMLGVVRSLSKAYFISGPATLSPLIDDRPLIWDGLITYFFLKMVTDYSRTRYLLWFFFYYLL